MTEVFSQKFTEEEHKKINTLRSCILHVIDKEPTVVIIYAIISCLHDIFDFTYKFTLKSNCDIEDFADMIKRILIKFDEERKINNGR